MRLLAISVVILAGCLMAGIGEVANNLPNAPSRNDLSTFGLVLSGAAVILFVIEWFNGLTRSARTERLPLHATADAV